MALSDMMAKMKGSKKTSKLSASDNDGDETSTSKTKKKKKGTVSTGPTANFMSRFGKK